MSDCMRGKAASMHPITSDRCTSALKRIVTPARNPLVEARNNGLGTLLLREDEGLALSEPSIVLTACVDSEGVDWDVGVGCVGARGDSLEAGDFPYLSISRCLLGAETGSPADWRDLCSV